MSSVQRKRDERYQNFMQALKFFRLSAKMTQTDVAEALGKSQDWVSRCETGEHPVTFVEALEFAELYRVDIIEFVNNIENTPTRRIKPDGFINLSLVEELGLTSQWIYDALNYAYSILDIIDSQLERVGSTKLASHVELANFSSIIGNLINAGLEKSSNGLYQRNKSHAYPDLLRMKINDEANAGLNVEVKLALETNKPKGHLPKAGYYLTVRYVLGTSEGYRQGIRGDTAWIWEVRLALLKKDDFVFSSTEGDSGKTAVIKTDAFHQMSLVYFDKDYCPYKKVPFSLE